tara:strand:+ start:5454 stop:6788 length:1335 start_codon:yes stop_codon:yes gene_type:complete
MQSETGESIEIDDDLRDYVTKDIVRQRYSLLNSQNFLADVVLSLRPEITTHAKGRDVPTAATDGVSLFVNPFYYCQLSNEYAMSLIMHEGAHKFLGHPWRMGERDPEIFNIAGDYAANYLIHESGHKIPEEWYFDKKYKMWTSERIYEDIRPEHEEGEEDPEHGEGEEVPEPVELDDRNGGEAGGSATGTAAQGEDKAAPAKPDGEFWQATDEEGRSLTDEENAESLRKNIDAISESREYRRMAGDSETAEQTVAIDRVTVESDGWETITSQFWRGKGNFRKKKWKKLNRRIRDTGVCIPGIDRVGVEWVVIAVDVSGSIMLKELRAFFSHIEKLREESPANRLTILPFNHIVLTKNILEIESGEDLPKEFSVGGGTSFSPVFNWVRRQEEEPDSVIIFTDLGSQDYGVPTECPVLWASSDPIYHVGDYSNRPPFGEVVEVEIV